MKTDFQIGIVHDEIRALLIGADGWVLRLYMKFIFEDSHPNVRMFFFQVSGNPFSEWFSVI